MFEKALANLRRYDPRKGHIQTWAFAIAHNLAINHWKAAVSPLEAIISVGPNSYGHPSADTISRLQAAGARVWRTDQCGTIVVVSDETTYNVTSSCTLKLYFPLGERCIINP